MTHREHPIWEEELMPYFDGQLDGAKASEIANHLETCEDCAAAVAHAKGLSQQMTEWKVEDSSQSMRERVLTEMRLQDRSKRSRQRWAWWTKRPVWA
ncbi:MAG TPA: zf-HC2 domain-containing protein, partial [Terriglobia bacterium]|nr:zf-HC2 domain-containing protein [Terriglobia bacterium]